MSDPVPQSPSDQPYETYYGLAHSPFTLSPDPRFLYLSESHDDALRALLAALRRKEGFIVLAGDIGTGKTTLCRAVVEQLDGTTFTSLILDPFLSVEALLREMLVSFGIASRSAARSGRLATASRHELVATLHEFLRSLAPLQGRCVLIVDEAQHLSPEVLEQIRIIANLETNEAKLLQVVLVGQLNLLDTLAAAEMRQLAQRVSVRARLKPLTRAELSGYVTHRLAVARDRNGTAAAIPGGGTRAAATFDAAALNAIHRLSGGVPRVINLLCDRALAVSARRGAAVIDAAAVGEAAAMLEIAAPDAVPERPESTSIPGDSPEVPAADAGRSRRLALGIAAALTVFAALVFIVIANMGVDPPASPPQPAFSLRLPAAIEPLPVPEPPPVPIRRRAPVVVPPEDALPPEPEPPSAPEQQLAPL